MENLADKHLRIARTLFNLAHTYLETTTTDVEQEDKINEDNEKPKTIKKDIQQTKNEEVNGKENDIIDKKREKKSELDNEIELYLQIQVESKLQQQLCTDIQNKKQNPEIEIELKIEIPPEFDGSCLKTADKEKQHFDEKVEKKSNISHEFNQKNKRENERELILTEMNADSEFQHGTERKIRLKQNISKANVDLNEKNINSLTTQNQIQKGNEIKLQEKNNIDVKLETELQKQIEELIFKVPLGGQKIETELIQEIKDLNKDIKELNPDNFNELNKEVLEEVCKKDYLPTQVKFLKNLYCSFIQDSTPFYNRLDQLSNDKTQSTVQQKLNEEFLKKLDGLLHQKCNEKTQEGINKDEIIQNQFEDINEKEKYQNYDLVIRYNHEMSQELKGHAQQVEGKKMVVDFYDDAVKTFIYKSDKDALKEKLCKAGTDVIDQTQKEGNKDIQFQLEFYKNVQFEDELQKKNEKQLQNNAKEETNNDLKLKIKENKTEVQKDSDIEIEDFEEEIQVYSNDEHFEEVHENSKFKIKTLEREIEVDSGVKIEEPEKEVLEDSDIDIEGFEGEILQFPEVEIEDFEEESQESTDSDTNDLVEEEFNDVNEVVEIIEDIEVESDCSTDNILKKNTKNILSDKVPTSICNELNLKINPNSKLTHDKEEKLKTINSSGPTTFTDHIKENQTFFELQNQLDELSQEYKGYVQQKVFQNLQQEMDDKQLQEMEIFPDKFNEASLNIEDIFQKEIDELQAEWCQLKPEFESNVPLSFEEDNSEKNEKKTEENFNLFEKLYSIHRKLLCKFADSKDWPENCFQPSSLLDVLFDDPNEIKPNVLVVILHSLDKGYSIIINTKSNSISPNEYFFNYHDDTILKHMEDEHLPPDLLDILELSRPRLFYSGCVIAEIHDQVDEVPGRVYRLMLRPFNMSIQRDIESIVAKNTNSDTINYWSYNKRLYLESLILLKSYPTMCMDSSPIAGVVVNLQHQVLSGRTIVLNPLKKKFNYSKPKSLETDLYNASDENLNTSMLSNEPQEGSSNLMDTENTNIEHCVLRKFDFRQKSLIPFKLFLLHTKEIQSFSMVLYTNTNSKVDSIKYIRFKIQLQNNSLNDYVKMMLYIFRERISPDINVFRKFRCHHNISFLLVEAIPPLINDNIYKASHADLSQIIDKFINYSTIKHLPMIKKLENMYAHNSGMTEFETKKNDLSFMQNKLATDTLTTNETKENSKNQEIKKNMLFCATKKLSTNSKKYLDVLKMDFKDEIADSSSLKTRSIPLDILFDEDASLTPSTIHDLSKIDLKDEISELLFLQPQTMDLLFKDDTKSLFKKKSTNTEVKFSLEPIHDVVSENDNSSDLVQEEIPSVSSSSIIPKVRFLTTTTPFESSPTVVLSSLSMVNSLVTSIKSYMLPIEAPSLGYITKSLPTGINLLTSTFNDDDDDIYTNVESLPVTQPDDLIHLKKIDDIAVQIFYFINKIMPATCNEMSPTENNITIFSKSQCEECRETLEDQCMLRYLQLFHQQPTLTDISIPPNTQINTHPTLGFPGDSFADCELLSDINTIDEIFPTHNLKNEDEISDNT